MIPDPALTAQPARERQRDLMAQALLRRLAAQAGISGRPWRRAGQVRVRWPRVLIRAIRPAVSGKA
jgi:hypothetical protein